MSTTKTIRVSEQTYEKIAKCGTFGDSFDSLLDRLASSNLNERKV
jgi:predicted CopG family antitoxin